MKGAGQKSLAEGKVNPILNSLYSFIGHTEIKRLINQIYSEQKISSFRTIAILSAVPKEGKTFFTAALALAYATMMQNKVLIINTVPEASNSDLLLKSVIGIHSEAEDGYNGKVPRVDMITARGDLNKRQSLGSDFQLASYIERFSVNYNVVLVDTSALSNANNSFIDPVIVAKNVDTSILVVSPKSLGHGTMRGIMSKLKRYGINPLGAVYNTGVR